MVANPANRYLFRELRLPDGSMRCGGPVVVTVGQGGKVERIVPFAAETPSTVYTGCGGVITPDFILHI